MQANVPKGFTVDFGKTKETYIVTTAKWTDATVGGLLQFALQEKANNAASGKSGKEAHAQVLKVFDAISTGVVRAVGGGGARLDPVFVEVRRILAARLKVSEAKLAKTVKTQDDADKLCRDIAKKANKANQADAFIANVRKAAETAIKTRSIDELL